MRHFLLVLLLAFAILAGTISGARADTALGVAFPPDGCSASSPFMSFNGPLAGNNTYCENGQFILKNALPSCSGGQDVAYDGTNFICKDAYQLPVCQSGYFLTTADGKTFTCQPVTAPICPTNQVLTFVNGAGFTCVDPRQQVPVCNGTNQFLIYSNGTFQCASASLNILPDCASGQVLTKINGTPTCVASPSGHYASCIKWCSGGFCLEHSDGEPGMQPIEVHYGIFAALYDSAEGCTATRQCDDGTWLPSVCHLPGGGGAGDGVGQGDG